MYPIGTSCGSANPKLCATRLSSLAHWGEGACRPPQPPRVYRVWGCREPFPANCSHGIAPKRRIPRKHSANFPSGTSRELLSFLRQSSSREDENDEEDRLSG